MENLLVQLGNDFTRFLHQGDVTAVTDENGHYRLTGLPAGQQVPLLTSSQQSPHLPALEFAFGARDGKSTTLDWGLKKGVWISGTALDKDLNQPVWGNVYYFVLRDNPLVALAEGFDINYASLRRSPFITDDAGQYRIPALQGRGLIAFKVIAGPEARGYPTSKGQEHIDGQINSGYWQRFDTLPSPCIAREYHSVKEVYPAEGQKIVPLDISLIAAVRLTLRLLDPAGNEVSGALYSGAWESGGSSIMQPMKSTGFHVGDYDLTYPRRLIFCHLERNLAGSVVLRGSQKNPVEVKLIPAGSLVGRVVNEVGKPVPRLLLQAAPLTEGRSHTEIAALPEPEYRTTAEGQFEIKGLAPGVSYNIVSISPGSPPMLIVANSFVESNKTTDVGNVRQRPLPAPQPLPPQNLK